MVVDAEVVAVMGSEVRAAVGRCDRRAVRREDLMGVDTSWLLPLRSFAT